MTIILNRAIRVAGTPYDAGEVLTLSGSVEADLVGRGDAYYDQKTRPYSGGSNVMSSAYFGITPDADCTGGFADLESWVRESRLTSVPSIELPPGTYYADRITLPAYYTVNKTYASVRIRGAGRTATVIRPNQSSEEIFLRTDESFHYAPVFEGLTFRGLGNTNPNQHGLVFEAEPNRSDYAGGVWYGHFRDVHVYGFAGMQHVVSGGLCDETALLPNMFLNYDNCRFERAAGVHWPTLLSTGQLGQTVLRNVLVDGSDRTNNAGPNLCVGTDPRMVYITVSAANTGTDVFTTATHGLRTAQPLRIIGDLTGLTSSPQLEKGTTYYAVPVSHKTAQNALKIATTAANAAAGTAIDITAAGTPGNYFFVPLWATAMAGDEFTTDAAHFLKTTDPVIPRGSNLPSGLTAGTKVYVIRTGTRTFKVASSLANAQARTPISLSGGTPADYGFTVGDSSAFRTTYSLDLDRVTSQNAEVALMLLGAECVDAKLYVEQTKRAVEAWRGSRVHLHSGRYWDAANDGGAGLLVFAENANTVVAWGKNNRVSGTTDAYFAALNGPATIDTGDNRNFQSISYAASITPNVRNGGRITVGTLTGAITVNVPTNGVAGDEITFRFVQDGTGSRAITWNAAFKAVGLAASGSANQAAVVRFRCEGSTWVQIGDAAWYS